MPSSWLQGKGAKKTGKSYQNIPPTLIFYCKRAALAPKRYIPKVLGQKKLDFSSSSDGGKKSLPEVIFKPS